MTADDFRDAALSLYDAIQRPRRASLPRVGSRARKRSK